MPDFNYVVGSAIKGIAPACEYANKYELPMAYIRQAQKEHGTRRVIEGVPESLKGKKVLLVISSDANRKFITKTIRDAGAIIVKVVRRDSVPNQWRSRAWIRSQREENADA